MKKSKSINNSDPVFSIFGPIDFMRKLAGSTLKSIGQMDLLVDKTEQRTWLLFEKAQPSETVTVSSR